MAFQPVPEDRLPKAGAGRAIPTAPDKLQESLKSPATMALESRKPWDTNSPIDRNPTKGDAPTNSCSEPNVHRCAADPAILDGSLRIRNLFQCLAAPPLPSAVSRP